VVRVLQEVVPPPTSADSTVNMMTQRTYLAFATSLRGWTDGGALLAVGCSLYDLVHSAACAVVAGDTRLC
jgi:hypothetical protein